MPTTAQAQKCFELCCNLTSKYCSIFQCSKRTPSLLGGELLPANKHRVSDTSTQLT
jgi:hypothetical protein